MTAEELIERLKVLPAETPVLVEGHETSYDDIAGLKPLKVTRYRNAQNWDGEYHASEISLTPKVVPSQPCSFLVAEDT